MASRRKLKKTIRFVSSELINEIYFKCLFSPKAKIEETEEIVNNIMKLSREFIIRANRPDGKENQKLVKKYFDNLFSSWNIEMEKILKEIDSI